MEQVRSRSLPPPAAAQVVHNQGCKPQLLVWTNAMLDKVKQTYNKIARATGEGAEVAEEARFCNHSL
jgi:hypothetical protein